jgi:hypothetical protein
MNWPQKKLYWVANWYLVLLGSLLASLELLKVPVADLHVAVMVVHAFSEALGGTGAVVVGLVLVLARHVGLLLGESLGGGRAATAEEAADGVADCRAYCYTAGERLAGFFQLLAILFGGSSSIRMWQWGNIAIDGE